MLITMTRNVPRGFSLIELLVATAAGAFLLSGLVSVFVTTLQHQTRMLNHARLEYELHALLDLIRSDLKRAGARDARVEATSPSDNDFLGLSVPREDCVLYSYASEPNRGGRRTPDDYAGLRLDDGRLRMKTSDTTCPQKGCTDCVSGHWATLNDERSTEITAARFDLHLLPAPGGYVVRVIELTLTARLRATPTIVRTVHAVVTLPNDVPAPQE